MYATLAAGFGACSTLLVWHLRPALTLHLRRRLLVFVQLLASIALILVILPIGSRGALVGIFNIGTVILRLNFLGHFDLLKSL